MTCIPISTGATAILTVALVASASVQAGEPDPNLSKFPSAKKIVTGAWKGAWSPDGKQLAYGTRDRSNLLVENLESGETRTLDVAGKDATWSPDGKWIAFVKEPRHDAYHQETVWIVTPDGDQKRKLAVGGFPQWSADSQRVFFHSRSDRSVYSIAVYDPESEPELFFPNALSWYPAISPDESKLAFGSNGALTIVDRVSGEVVLSFPAKDSRGLLPAWSPDGRLLAYGGFNTDRLGVWVLDVSSKKARRIAKGTYTMPGWSPDGSKLTFDYRSGEWEIWSVDLEAILNQWDR